MSRAIGHAASPSLPTRFSFPGRDSGLIMDGKSSAGLADASQCGLRNLGGRWAECRVPPPWAPDTPGCRLLWEGPWPLWTPPHTPQSYLFPTSWLSWGSLAFSEARGMSSILETLFRFRGQVVVSLGSSLLKGSQLCLSSGLETPGPCLRSSADVLGDTASTLSQGSQPGLRSFPTQSQAASADWSGWCLR